MLKRTLTLPSLIFYGTGMILGAGIYSIIGKAAGIVGTTLWFSFVLAALSAGMTALSYCELATFKPKAGAEFVYVQSAFPRWTWLANSIGLVMALAGISTASAVALAFGGYLNGFIDLAPLMTGFLLLCLLSLVNIVGTQESSRLNMLFTLIEVLGLILFIYLGFSIKNAGLILIEPISPKVLTGTALIIFAYFGFEDIVNLVEDAKDPERTVPKAILWSLGISTVIYIFVSFAALSIAPLEKLVSSEAPLMEAAAAASPKMAIVLGICALFSTANTVLIALLAASRAFYGMSMDRKFPSIFGKVLPKRRTPWLASLLVLGLSIALLPLSGVEVIASVSSFATLIGFFTVNITLIRLRFTKPNEIRPFTVPLNLGKFPVIPALAAISTAILLMQFTRIVYVIGISTIVLILISQFLYHKFKTASQSGSL